MKRSIVIVIICLLCGTSFSVQGQQLSKRQLRDSIAYVTDEPQVVAYCKQLYSTPCNASPLNLKAAMYILDWMQHTYNYNFLFDQRFLNIIKINTEVCNRYAAALAQICIEDKIYNNSVALQVKAISMLLNYCENPSNQVFISSGLQKYIDAMKSGTLQEQIASDFR